MFPRQYCVIALMLVACSAFALDPLQPVERWVNGSVVERRASLPTSYVDADGNTTINYHAATYRHESDGWRQATVTTTETVVTNLIPTAIQQVAASYKSTLEGIFGGGAETNRALDNATIAITLSLDTNVTAETGLRLSTWFEILDGYWGRGEVWTYPWGATEYIVTNKSTVWESEQ